VSDAASRFRSLLNACRPSRKRNRLRVEFNAASIAPLRRGVAGRLREYGRGDTVVSPLAKGGETATTSFCRLDARVMCVRR